MEERPSSISAAVGVAVISLSGNRDRSREKRERLTGLLRLALADGVDPGDTEEIKRRLAVEWDDVWLK